MQPSAHRKLSTGHGYHRCIQKGNYNWQPSVPPLSLTWHVDRQPHSQLVGADGDATRGPGAKTSWMAYMYTETRISFLLTPLVCLASLIQLVKHI